MSCPLCRDRRGRRACPALGESICSICCGTKRLVEVPCPSDCGYLASAREHPPAVVVRQRQKDLGLLAHFMRDLNRLHPVETVAADARSGVVLAAGGLGVHRRRKQARIFELVSARESTEKVTLPSDWLLCSGSHQLDVASALDDER